MQTNELKNNTKQYFSRILIETDNTLDDIVFNINDDIHNKNMYSINIHIIIN